MKTALFVDFDNVFSGLYRIDEAHAKCFASRPALWMRWLVESLPSPYADAFARRRILVRHCYLNPERYGSYRRAFSQAGFYIVDCPPTNRLGKAGTDIHMVLDIVDALRHRVRYDEFMIFSADADFSPALRGLRSDDRCTAVLAAGAVSRAYEASADPMIDLEGFVREALGLPPGVAAPAEAAQEASAVAAVGQPAVASITATAAAVAPAKAAPVGAAPAIPVQARSTAVVEVDKAARVPALPQPAASPCSTTPGHDIDPCTRSPQACQPATDLDVTAEAIERLLEAARLPVLSPRGYAAALAALAQALAENGFDLAMTSRRICDLCAERHAPVSRDHAYRLLRSLHREGFVPVAGASDTDDLASLVCASAVAACAREAVTIDGPMQVLLMQWFRGEDPRLAQAAAVSP